MKRYVALAILVIMASSLYLLLKDGKSKLTTHDNKSTILFNAISLEHPQDISVSGPLALDSTDSEEYQEIAGKINMKKTTGRVVEQDIDSLREEVSTFTGNYFVTLHDSLNNNNIRTVIFGPPKETGDYTDEQILHKYILYTSSEIIPDVTVYFEFDCLYTKPDPDSTFEFLSCHEVKTALNIISESINFLDTEKLKLYIEKQKALVIDDEPDEDFLQKHNSPVSNREKEDDSKTSSVCTYNTLYSFPYYVAPNTKSVCYKTTAMNNADANNLRPLEAIPLKIVKELVPGATKETAYDFAFDSANFFVNGDMRYSVSNNTFQYIQQTQPDQVGLILVNGIEYRVIMTGLVGATLE